MVARHCCYFGRHAANAAWAAAVGRGAARRWGACVHEHRRGDSPTGELLAAPRLGRSAVNGRVINCVSSTPRDSVLGASLFQALGVFQPCFSAIHQP
jgi:hypothetical protein